MPNRYNFDCIFCGITVRTNYKHEKEECSPFCEEYIQNKELQKKESDT